MKNKVVRSLVIIITILIVIDQVSKFLIVSLFPEGIGNDYLKIETVKNTGMAFGFNEGNVRNIFLSIFVLAIVINFIKNQLERLDKKTIISLSLVLAGGISNLIDRFFRGGVLDFIKIPIIPNFIKIYKFPTFNIADLYVVIGWVLLIIFLIDFSKKK